MNSRCSALELAPWANRGGLLDAGLPREAVLPALNHGFGHARLTHDRVRPEPIDAPQHDAGARRTNAGYFGPQRRFRADGKLRSKARKRCHCASRQTLGADRKTKPQTDSTVRAHLQGETASFDPVADTRKVWSTTSNRSFIILFPTECPPHLPLGIVLSTNFLLMNTNSA